MFTCNKIFLYGWDTKWNPLKWCRLFYRIQNVWRMLICQFRITQILWHKQEVQPNTHYCDVIMGAMAYQITSLTIGYSIVYTSADQRKHQSSASLAVVRGIHQWPVNSPHKWPVTRKMFPFDDVTMGITVRTFRRKKCKIAQSVLNNGRIFQLKPSCIFSWPL